MQTKYGDLPDEILEKYLQKVIGKIFKILPMREKECETLGIYLDSLLIELIGNRELIYKLKHEPDFLTLLGTLEYFINNESEVKVYKREVFKMIGIIEKLKDRYFVDVGGW